MIKRAFHIEQMETAMKEGGPGNAITMEGLWGLLHETCEQLGVWCHECQVAIRQRSMERLNT
jgi:hypothetical protein